DPRLLDEITRLVAANRRPAWIDIHQLRAWRSGSDIHIDLHLILHRETTLENAHREGKVLEGIFDAHFDGAAKTLIHLDPCVDEECPVCGEVCNLRHREFQTRLEWNRTNLTSQGGAGERFTMMVSGTESTEEGSG
ncbi:MAG: cation transporter dimerization domain-containing protein, partial [Thermodesulfobacteriota bacterium]